MQAKSEVACAVSIGHSDRCDGMCDVAYARRFVVRGRVYHGLAYECNADFVRSTYSAELVSICREAVEGECGVELVRKHEAERRLSEKKYEMSTIDIIDSIAPAANAHHLSTYYVWQDVVAVAGKPLTCSICNEELDRWRTNGCWRIADEKVRTCHRDACRQAVIDELDRMYEESKKEQLQWRNARKVFKQAKRMVNELVNGRRQGARKSAIEES